MFLKEDLSKLNKRKVEKRVELPPDLISECNGKIFRNFPKYGNSWKDSGHTQYWIDRIFDEFKELQDAPNHWERREELIDIINICRMMHYNEDGGVA